MSQCVKPLLCSPCQSLLIPQGTFSPVVVLLWSESCLLQLLMLFFRHLSLLSLLQGAPMARAARSSPSTAKKIIYLLNDKYCFPREEISSVMPAGSKTHSPLRMPYPRLLSTFVFLSGLCCALECLAVCRDHLWKKGRLLSLWPVLKAQVLWLTARLHAPWQASMAELRWHVWHIAVGILVSCWLTEMKRP